MLASAAAMVWLKRGGLAIFGSFYTIFVSTGNDIRLNLFIWVSITLDYAKISMSSHEDMFVVFLQLVSYFGNFDRFCLFLPRLVTYRRS